MRRVTERTAIGLMAILAAPSHAAARTSNAICKVACAPRIAGQCAGLSGAELRRCPRPAHQGLQRSRRRRSGVRLRPRLTATLAGRVVRTVEANVTDIILREPTLLLDRACREPRARRLRCGPCELGRVGGPDRRPRARARSRGRERLGAASTGSRSGGHAARRRYAGVASRRGKLLPRRS